VDDVSYEAYDEANQKPLEGIFLSGWAREASSGLVGTARKDGQHGADAMMQYIATLPAEGDPKAPFETLEALIADQYPPVVRSEDYRRLAKIEEEKAEELGIEYFKFNTNEEMFEAMGLLAAENRS